uniref:Phospholipase B-like n=1 Tax=Alexandrium monilatum TaxID=311494 RepID=A0A7S4QAK3_9DINO|mmetsp:Transcript_27928/g.83498  ORF Transcript_27928/g.83498 Transcript_27928/m.83498 type:complete len:300 (+) Transcript_27928:67-966(+)
MCSVLCWLAALSALTAVVYHIPRPSVYDLPWVAKPCDPARSKRLKRSWGLPNIIIQYGPGRTASTMQFQSLCAIMLLMHSSEAELVNCGYTSEFFTATLCDEEGYWVIKTHHPGAVSHIVATAAGTGHRIWVFTSANDTAHAKQIEADLGVKVTYAQTMHKLSVKGYFLVSEYQPIFGLTDDQTEVLLQYMRFWHVVRQCCGREMSIDWRHDQLNKTSISRRKRTGTFYAACEIYDLDVVENATLNSRMLREHTAVPWLLRRASFGDLEMNGTWCTWFNRQVVCQNLDKTNVNPTEPYC